MDAFTAGALNPVSPIEFSLVLLTQPDEEVFVKTAITSLLQWIEPSLQIIHVKSPVRPTEKLCRSGLEVRKSMQQHGHRAVVPAISIMLFLPEHGSLSFHDIREVLSKAPWKFHHKIELSSRRTPSFNIARQEYFFLREGLPLWSVNPVHRGKEHIRICIFARNFQEMVEFYRFVTDREMESTKPGFCTFVLYSSSTGGLGVQLTIKYSPNILPQTMDPTFLFFKIKDIRSLRPMYQSKLLRLQSDTYRLTDPDGNHVVLQEVRVKHFPRPTEKEGKMLVSKYNDANSESQDSGRWSNNDTYVTTNHNCKTELCAYAGRSSDIETISQISFATTGAICNNFQKYPLHVTNSSEFNEVWL
ncbi:protein FAM124A-like [Liolophura sinensis]|uniref:protein FAM124A-like n=1 Tax=Liolophura sinensis TaxID=3198878 RepID=UPI00315806B5